MTQLTLGDPEFRETRTPGVTVHVASGLAGTIRVDGIWRPLPFGSCATCGEGSGRLRGNFKRTAPSIQCDLHRGERWRKPRPVGVKRWDFEADMVIPAWF